MWTLFGCVGQMGANAWSVPRQQPDPKENFWTRMAKKSWSPITVMTDAEYADLIRERLVKVEAEIAVIDDKIAELRKQEVVEDGGEKQTVAQVK